MSSNSFSFAFCIHSFNFCNIFIKTGDIVIDYGCGSGGYTKKISELIGESGKVYAVDIYDLAIEAVKKKISNYQLTNVETLLAKDIATIPSNISDVIIAIDMFHMVQETDTFLKRITSTS